MDQEKIGKFIAELRKEKKLTQIDLANKLGITDRAISKWENGRGMPDLSLLSPLCEILNISINELLSGSKLDKKNYQEKLEENIINTINYTNKKIKKTKNIFFIILSVIIMFMIMFVIDINRMRNNKPVIFSTWGYKYTPAINFNEEKVINAVEKYLLEKLETEPKYHENEKSFVSIKTYLTEEKNNHKLYNIYVWVLEEKYYLENNEIKQDSSSSIPYMFMVEHINEKYKVTNFKKPRDGSYYAEDIKKIFPRTVRNNMDKIHTDGTIEKLKTDIQKQVNLYFHK